MRKRTQGIVKQKISITRKGCLIQIPIPNAPIGIYFRTSLPAYGTSGLCNNTIHVHVYERTANITLTHLCRVEASTLFLWTGPFPIKVVPGYFYYYSVL